LVDSGTRNCLGVWAMAPAYKPASSTHEHVKRNIILSTLGRSSRRSVTAIKRLRKQLRSCTLCSILAGFQDHRRSPATNMPFILLRIVKYRRHSSAQVR
jgi:hypothetical protein